MPRNLLQILNLHVKVRVKLKRQWRARDAVLTEIKGHPEIDVIGKLAIKYEEAFTIGNIPWNALDH
jgi:hypothetical protein